MNEDMIFYGGGGIFGGGGGTKTIEIDPGPSAAELEAQEAAAKKKARRKAARDSGSKFGRGQAVLTGGGSTAHAPTRKSTLLGHSSTTF